MPISEGGLLLPRMSVLSVDGHRPWGMKWDTGCQGLFGRLAASQPWMEKGYKGESRVGGWRVVRDRPVCRGGRRMDLSGSLSESIHSTVVSLMRERATRRQQNRQQRVCGFISAAASPTSGPQIDPAAQTVLSPLPKHLTAFLAGWVKWPSVLWVTAARSVAFYMFWARQEQRFSNQMQEQASFCSLYFRLYFIYSTSTNQNISKLALKHPKKQRICAAPHAGQWAIRFAWRMWIRLAPSDSRDLITH